MKHILFLIIVNICFTSHAQNTFEKTLYLIRGFEVGRSIRQVSDGGYIIAGSQQNFVTGNYDIFLVRTNNTGDTLWTKNFGGSGNDEAYAVKQSKDGGFIIAGRTNTFAGEAYSDISIIKTDANGMEMWSKIYGGRFDDYCYDISQTSDNGFIICGRSKNMETGSFDMYLLKTDVFGAKQWEKYFGGRADDGGVGAVQTTDGGFIVLGHTASAGKGNTDIYLVKADKNGKKEWEKTFGSELAENASCIMLSPDGGYILSGTVYEKSRANIDILVIKTDDAGNVLWSQQFDESQYDKGYAFTIMENGNIAITGGVFNNTNNEYDILLLMVSSEGKRLWSKKYGGNYNNEAYAISKTLDGGLIITGYTEGFGTGSSDIIIIKTDVSGEY